MVGCGAIVVVVVVVIEVERKSLILRGKQKSEQKIHERFFLITQKRKTHTHTHTHARTLFTNNNAECGIVCSQERRRRARASERYDQTMRGDARHERWFCYIKSYLKCVLCFVSWTQKSRT